MYCGRFEPRRCLHASQMAWMTSICSPVRKPAYDAATRRVSPQWEASTLTDDDVNDAGQYWEGFRRRGRNYPGVDSGLGVFFICDCCTPLTGRRQQSLGDGGIHVTATTGNKRRGVESPYPTITHTQDERRTARPHPIHWTTHTHPVPTSIHRYPSHRRGIAFAMLLGGRALSARARCWSHNCAAGATLAEY